MKKHPSFEEPTLIQTFTTKGAALLGVAGTVAGALLGQILALPAAVAAVGYSAGGWAAGLTGLAAGALLNLMPVYRTRGHAEPQPPSKTSPEQPESHSKAGEYVRAGHVAGELGAIAGGLTGVFTGAVLGAGVGCLVQMSEARQAYLSGLTPDEMAEHRRQLQNRSRNDDLGPK